MNHEGIMSLWDVFSPLSGPLSLLLIVGLYLFRNRIKDVLASRKQRRELQSKLADAWTKMVMDLTQDTHKNWTAIVNEVFGGDSSSHKWLVRMRVNPLHREYADYYWKCATRGVAIQYFEAGLRYRNPRISEEAMNAAVFSHFCQYEDFLEKDRVFLRREGIPEKYLDVPFHKTMATVT